MSFQFYRTGSRFQKLRHFTQLITELEYLTKLYLSSKYHVQSGFVNGDEHWNFLCLGFAIHEVGEDQPSVKYKTLS